MKKITVKNTWFLMLVFYLVSYGLHAAVTFFHLEEALLRFGLFGTFMLPIVSALVFPFTLFVAFYGVWKLTKKFLEKEGGEKQG